ncbi:trigger factor, partial [Acinetobacter baumannii]
ALRDSGLAVHGTPRLTVDEFEREPARCVFTAKIGLEPQVTMGEYKGIEVTKPSVEVTDEDVERQIDDFRRRGGRKQAVKDRGASAGD